MKRPHALLVLRVGFAIAWMSVLGAVGAQLWAINAVPDGLWRPLGPAQLLDGPPSPSALGILWLAAAASTLTLGLGWRTGASGAISLVSSSLLLSVHNSLGQYDHGQNLILLFLLVFQFSDWGRAPGLDARRSPAATPPSSGHAPMQVFLAVAALAYFSSGVLKITREAFLASGRMATFIASANAPGTAGAADWAQPIADWLMRTVWASDLLALASLMIELSVGLALLGRAFRIGVAGLLILFHAGIAVLTGISFHTSVLVCFLIAVAAWCQGPYAARQGPTMQETRRQLGALVLVGVAALAVGRWLPGETLLGAPAAARLVALLLSPLFAPGIWIYFILAGSAAVATAGFLILRAAARATSGPTKPGGADGASERTFLYDGGCGFCKRWCQWAARRTGPGIQFAPCQLAEEVRVRAGVPAAACLHAAYYIEATPAGVRVERGAGAIHAVLREFTGRRRAGWRLLSLTYRLEGIRQAQDWGYRLVAANRHRLGDDACTVPVAPPPLPPLPPGPPQP